MNSMSRTRGALVAGVLGAALVLVPATAWANDNGSITVTAAHNDAASASPRSGVVFTLGRVAGIDPTTAAGREAVTRLRDAMPASTPTVVDVVRLDPTDAQGHTQLTGLADGVYVLHEQGVLDGSGTVTADADGYGDILVALPMTDDTGASATQVDVMPKPAPQPVATTEPSQTPTTEPSEAPSGSQTPQPSDLPLPVGSVPSASRSSLDGTPGGTNPGTTNQGTTTPGATNPGALPLPATQTQPSDRTRINSGGGSEFDGAQQWATIVAGVAMVPAVFLGTRRRKKDED